MITIFRNLFLILTVSLLFQACTRDRDEEKTKIKYAFLFIGDGMGVAQVNLTEAYLAAIDNEKGFKQLSFTQFPEAGLVKTYANNRFITCSAAAATAFSTSHKTNINRISMDTSGMVPFKSIATICKENDMKVGILSSVSIDHATPAVFYANQPLRSNYFEIGIDLSKSNFDFFGGGGFRTPVGIINGKEVNAIELSKENHFTYIDSNEGLVKLKPGNGKVIAVHPNLLVGSSAMPYAIDQPEQPSLADFTAKAIQYLDNENGFFMMVEGGKIDWACHSKDAATSIHETIAFDEAIQEAIAFYTLHPNETLILVTADHETGGMALGADATEYESYFHLLQYQKMSIDAFNEKVEKLSDELSGKKSKNKELLFDLIADNFGLGDEIPLTEDDKSLIWRSFKQSLKKSAEAKETMYAELPSITETLIKLVSDKAGVGWTTYGHTGINVPIYAIGPGSEQFSGVIDNTEIPKKILDILQIDMEANTNK